MGRLPDKYGDIDIVERQPYALAGELFVTAGAKSSFPPSTFIDETATNQPFEIHRMIVRLTAFDDGTFNTLGVVQIFEPQPDCSGMVELQIYDLSRDEAVTKFEALVLGLLSEDAQTWEWDEPFTVDAEAGLQIDAIPATSFLIDNGSALVPAAVDIGNVGSIRVEITLEGYLLDLAEPPVLPADTRQGG